MFLRPTNTLSTFSLILAKSLGVFLLALIIKLAYFSLITPASLISPDSHAYQSLAEGILTSQPYGSISGTVQGGFPADLQRPPGYSLFIYLASTAKQVSSSQVAIFQIILSSLLAAALCFCASQLISPHIGIIAGFFYAIDWVTTINSPLLMADTIYTVAINACLIIWLYYFSHPKLYLIFIGGILLGVAALIKPTAQFIIIPLILILLMQAHRRLISVLLLIAIYALLTVPWMLRNYNQHGIFTLSSIGVVSLGFYVAEGALAGEQMTLTDTRALDERMVKKSTYWDSLNVLPVERKKMMEEEAWTVIRSHWPTVIKQSLQGLIRTCIGTGAATFKAALAHELGSFQNRLWGTVLPLLQISLYWVLAAYALFNQRKIVVVNSIIFRLIVLTLIFSLLPSAMALGNARFRTHATPLLCLLASIGFISLLKQILPYIHTTEK
jgi:4-amino-4-deoxy-L-arabinose transferase-like glycosyltransferase